MYKFYHIMELSVNTPQMLTRGEIFVKSASGLLNWGGT